MAAIMFSIWAEMLKSTIDNILSTARSTRLAQCATGSRHRELREVKLRDRSSVPLTLLRSWEANHVLHGWIGEHLGGRPSAKEYIRLRQELPATLDRRG